MIGSMWNLRAEGKSKWESDPAVTNLRSYLRIRSEQPQVNYDECIKFLKQQADGLGLPCEVVEEVAHKPVLVMTWRGSDPSLPAVLLNSHMDVVPVFEKSWSHPPFDAYMDDSGLIFGRGVQDMKSVAIQYIEAVRRLKAAGVTPKRTVHLSFVPDEEISGVLGMAVWVKSDHFKSLNVGFALDEGYASADENYLVFNGERTIWPMYIHCSGKSGHGSLLHDDTAGEKIRYMIDKFMDLRAENKRRLQSDPRLTIGDVTTVNLTMLRGGVQSNVVPEKLSALFDIRLALDVNLQEFEDMVSRWCQKAGPGVTYEFERKSPYVAATKLDDHNIYWGAFKQAADELGLKLQVRTFPGGTDSRYIRELGTPALGFSPLACTPVKLHEHDEALSADTFLKGITYYEKIIPKLANA